MNTFVLVYLKAYVSDADGLSSLCRRHALAATVLDSLRVAPVARLVGRTLVQIARVATLAAEDGLCAVCGTTAVVRLVLRDAIRVHVTTLRTSGFDTWHVNTFVFACLKPFG